MADLLVSGSMRSHPSDPSAISDILAEVKDADAVSVSDPYDKEA